MLTRVKGNNRVMNINLDAEVGESEREKKREGIIL